MNEKKKKKCKHNIQPILYNFNSKEQLEKI